MNKMSPKTGNHKFYPGLAANLPAAILVFAFLIFWQMWALKLDAAYILPSPTDILKRLWELRGRVRIHTKNQLQFKSEELFWDENQHQLYSNKFSQLNTPERQLQGTHFVSNEQMTKYHVTNTKAAFERGDIDSKPAVSEEGNAEEMISRPPKQPMPLTR